MDLLHHTQDQILIVIPEGKNLNALDASLFKENVMTLITNNAAQKVILDLQHLHFIDSSGLGSFLFVLKNLNNVGGELKLAKMSKSIRTMFELVSMHNIFEIFNSTEEAICSFNTKKEYL